MAKTGQMTITVDLSDAFDAEFDIGEELKYFARAAIKEELRRRFNAQAREAMLRWLDAEFKDGKPKVKDGIVYVPLLAKDVFDE